LGHTHYCVECCSQPGARAVCNQQCSVTPKHVSPKRPARLAPIQWLTRAPPPPRLVQRPGREGNHSSPSCAEVKNKWNSTSNPPYSFMACSMTAQHLSCLYYSRVLTVRVKLGLAKNYKLRRIEVVVGNFF
jgi:hypothetical protein